MPAQGIPGAISFRPPDAHPSAASHRVTDKTGIGQVNIERSRSNLVIFHRRQVLDETLWYWSSGIEHTPLCAVQYGLVHRSINNVTQLSIDLPRTPAICNVLCISWYTAQHNKQRCSFSDSSVCLYARIIYKHEISALRYNSYETDRDAPSFVHHRRRTAGFTTTTSIC